MIRMTEVVLKAHGGTPVVVCGVGHELFIYLSCTPWWQSPACAAAC